MLLLWQGSPKGTDATGHSSEPAGHQPPPAATSRAITPPWLVATRPPPRERGVLLHQEDFPGMRTNP